ncbi:GFA family protein [Microvirga sp. M2]|uniref:GFA family protein n=1 Tax=Microvirga sp. M2 TaxID=3073270 RepID=UPI0039C3EB45
MMKTYRGSCHCKAVTFEVDIDLAGGTGRCNCSICMKTRNWNAIVKPAAFRLRCWPEDVAEYSFGTGVGKYKFCKVCGVHSFSTGNIPEIGGDFVSVRVNCLDDVPEDELAAAPVNFADGRNDNWRESPKFTCHL